MEAKSRSYSTTFAALRGERAELTAARQSEALGLAADDAVTVLNDWRYAGRGQLSADLIGGGR
ncbi:replication initiator [Streptomyces tateyamensis]|uniref:replication initiator n=1 Tax=Streptomyces tateyamensis TaxID=565073 RepID=UPI00319E0420